MCLCFPLCFTRGRRYLNLETPGEMNSEGMPSVPQQFHQEYNDDWFGRNMPRLKSESIEMEQFSMTWIERAELMSLLKRKH